MKDLFRLLLTIVLIFLVACSNQDQRPQVTIGTPKSVMASLTWLADDLGYFEEQGIDLTIKNHASGKVALDAMIAGSVDLAVSAETPFVIESFNHDDLRLFASLGQSDNELHVLARLDHGISSPDQLQGKIIGTQKGSAVHFFLSSFLLYYQLNEEDLVQIRFMPAVELVGALKSGEIDAFSLREPFTSQARREIGEDKLINFHVPGLYTKTYNLVGNKEFTLKYPGVMPKILLALHKAAIYSENHPKEFKDILFRRLQIPKVQIDAMLPDVRLGVTLNQGVLTTLHEEAAWAVSSGQVDPASMENGKVLDFLSRLDTQPLQEALPDALGLIGINHE